MNKILGAFLLLGLLVIGVACTAPAESKSVSKEIPLYLNSTDIVIDVSNNSRRTGTVYVNPHTNCLYLSQAIPNGYGNFTAIVEQQYNVETGKCEGYYQKYLK